MTAGVNGLQALLAEARRLDRVYAAAQHLPQDDTATEQVLEEAHFDAGADETTAIHPDPFGSGWLAWWEG